MWWQSPLVRAYARTAHPKAKHIRGPKGGLSSRASASSASPAVHLSNVDGDWGKSLYGAIRPTVWKRMCASGAWPSGFEVQIHVAKLHEKARRVLDAAAREVRRLHSGTAESDRAAQDLSRHRDFWQPAVLLYGSDATLGDHVDGTGHYLVLFSVGCSVDFTAGDEVIGFRSGDALVFNGGWAHAVMHGVRKVRDREMPIWVPGELLGKRLSLQVRQNSDVL